MVSADRPADQTEDRADAIPRSTVVRGQGFVRPRDKEDPLTTPPTFVEIGETYVRQIVDLSPGQRKKYLGHLKVLAETEVRGSLIFTRPVTQIGEADLMDWVDAKMNARFHSAVDRSLCVCGAASDPGSLATGPSDILGRNAPGLRRARPASRSPIEHHL